MMAVALMSDSSSKGRASTSSGPTWGKFRLGQFVLLVELTEQLRRVRTSKDMSAVRRNCLLVFPVTTHLSMIDRRSLR